MVVSERDGALDVRAVSPRDRAGDETDSAGIAPVDWPLRPFAPDRSVVTGVAGSGLDRAPWLRRPVPVLGVAATGAYCYSMSSRYNLIGRPAVVAVRDGSARLILRRETVDDLLSLEVTNT